MSSFFGRSGSGWGPWASKPDSQRDRKDDPDPRLDPRKVKHESNTRPPNNIETNPQPPVQPDTTAVIPLAFLLGSATALGASIIYRRFFKRIKNAEWVTPDMLERKRWISGVVTSVGDADNFRLYHTPGFGWRGPFKFRHLPATGRGLRGKTIHIRMAGVDAPEMSHFGKPAQPYSAEAFSWLKETIEGRRIQCQLLSRDQYKRVVAIPLLPPRPWRWWTRIGPTRNLSLEMVRTGWGFVYEEAGAEYGHWGKEPYQAAEAEARAARRGVWQGGNAIESPAEYKKRYRMAKGKVEDAKEVEPEPESSLVGLWSKIMQLSRGKKARKNNSN